MNNNTQWRPLQQSDFANRTQSNDYSSAFQPLGVGQQRQMPRQITKNPQNMFQSFNSPGSNFMSTGGGSRPSGFGDSTFNGPLSPDGVLASSSSTGRLTTMMSSNNGSYDFARSSDQLRISPSFNNMTSIGVALNGNPRSGSLLSSSNNGFDRSFGGHQPSGALSFERSNINGGSGGGIYPGASRSPGGYGRQVFNAGGNQFGMSRHVEGNSDNGFGSMFNSGRRTNNSPPPSFGGPMSDMKIGTWDSGSCSSNGRNVNTREVSSFPQVSTFEIGTFNLGPQQSDGKNCSGNDGYAGNSRNNPRFNTHPAALSGGGPGIRETGIIEKLLHSYGFIQCCDRQARLFFHFSQFDGTIEHLKIGDPVEFEMTYDRRTGKPIASMVSKIAPEIVMSEERVIGVVTTEPKVDPETKQLTPGRISYENRGECFFLPFTVSDVEGNVTVNSGDKCSFQMATMARSGNLVARTIRLENPAAPVKYRGVVNSVKEGKSFGFIERSDVVREIFFHFAEVEEGENVDLGHDVEFTIQTRNGKEVACNITALTPGTVIFEDVGTDIYKGQVLKPLDRSFKYTGEGEALNGRVKFRASDRSEAEIPFGEKDQVGDFTLRHGDWVEFVIAVDRRDKLKRATRIQLMDQSFDVSDERREQGVVHSLRDGFGFMRCADRYARMLFHFSECLDVKRTVVVGDECEFTVSPDPNQMTRFLATRIKHLPAGSVKFDIVIHQNIQGKVEVEPSAQTCWSPPRSGGSSSPDKSGANTEEPPSSNSKEGAGKIIYDLNGLALEIPVYAGDCDPKSFPHKGDLVQFDINQSKATKETNAVNIHIKSSPTTDASLQDSLKNSLVTHQGYIAAVKDGFGFVETLTFEKEIFFHFSNVEGKPEKLEVGLEVEYTIFNREKGGSKVSAEGLTLLPKGTIPALPAKEEVLNGKVVRSLRSINPDQEDYCGLIQVKTEEGNVVSEYKFGIACMVNKKELLQVGDPVQFQVHLIDGNFAVNIQATREKLRAFVEAMKGQFGFLSYEVDDGKKLFFHSSEVEGGELLQQGDEVEFVAVTNKRNGKKSACCVRKLSSTKRPERLISKLKTMNLEDAARGGKKIVVIRQPKGPEGNGFRVSRNI